MTALILSILAAGLLLLMPCWYRGITATEKLSDGPPFEQGATTCASLVEVNGWGVAVWVLLPVLLAGSGVIVSWKGMVAAVWVVAVLMLFLTVITVFSIGWLFTPVTLVLLTVAVLQHADRGKVSPPLEL